MQSRGCGMDFYRFTRKIVKGSKRYPSNSVVDIVGGDEMLIFVKLPSNKSIILMIDSFHKIATVKEKIEEKERFPCARQCLYFSGKRLNDSETLGAYNITKDSTLHLKLRAEPTPCDIVSNDKVLIFVKLPSNKSVPLVLERFDKIATIKEKIEEKELFPCAGQHLYYSGKLLDDSASLATYNIIKDCTLHLKLWADETPCEIAVHVLPVNGFITLKIPRGLRATIGELKDCIHEQQGVECQDLYLDEDVTGEQLANNVTLQACRVPEQTLVWVQSVPMALGGSSPVSLNRLTRPANASHGDAAFVTQKAKASRGLVDAAFEEAFSGRRTVPRHDDMEPLAVLKAPEQKSCPGQVSDIETAIATVLQTHQDCERKLSLMLDEKNKLQTDLLELQSKYPKLLSEVLEERNNLQRDLKEIQSEFPRKLSLVLDEKNKLQQHLSELQNEFRQMSLVLDDNAKLQRDSISLQNQLESLNIELGQERERSLCNICFDKPRDTLVFSCLHLHFCSACLQKHQERTNTCPTCRSFISGKLVCNLSIS